MLIISIFFVVKLVSGVTWFIYLILIARFLALISAVQYRFINARLQRLVAQFELAQSARHTQSLALTAEIDALLAAARVLLHTSTTRGHAALHDMADVVLGMMLTLEDTLEADVRARDMGAPMGAPVAAAAAAHDEAWGIFRRHSPAPPLQRQRGFRRRPGDLPWAPLAPTPLETQAPFLRHEAMAPPRTQLWEGDVLRQPVSAQYFGHGGAGGVWSAPERRVPGNGRERQHDAQGEPPGSGRRRGLGHVALDMGATSAASGAAAALDAEPTGRRTRGGRGVASPTSSGSASARGSRRARGAPSRTPRVTSPFFSAALAGSSSSDSDGEGDWAEGEAAGRSSGRHPPSSRRQATPRVRDAALRSPTHRADVAGGIDPSRSGARSRALSPSVDVGPHTPPQPSSGRAPGSPSNVHGSAGTRSAAASAPSDADPLWRRRGLSPDAPMGLPHAVSPRTAQDHRATTAASTSAIAAPSAVPAVRNPPRVVVFRTVRATSPPSVGLPSLLQSVSPPASLSESCPAPAAAVLVSSSPTPVCAAEKPCSPVVEPRGPEPSDQPAASLEVADIKVEEGGT